MISSSTLSSSSSSSFLVSAHQPNSSSNNKSSYSKTTTTTTTSVINSRGGDDGDGLNKNNNNNINKNIIIRFHFIRHGETEANKLGLVLGQIDSELTSNGKQQAIMTGKALNEMMMMTSSSTTTNDNNNKKTFQFTKCYASDLDRTVNTARLIVQNAYPPVPTTFSIRSTVESDNNNIINNKNKRYLTFITSSDYSDRSSPNALPINIYFDELLRERAKGIREGRPKKYNDNEMLKLHKLEEQYVGHTIPIPKYETENEVYNRLSKFIGKVVNEIITNEEEEEEEESDATTTIDVNGNSNIKNNDDNEQPKIIHILAISHSASIRILTNNIINKDRHWIGGGGGGGDSSSSSSSISESSPPPYEIDLNRVVPNLSITCIDVVPITQYNNKDDTTKTKPIIDDNEYDDEYFMNSWRAIDAKLPSVKHLKDDLVTAGDDEVVKT